jgi:outer membrane protein assembly factor BamB
LDILKVWARRYLWGAAILCLLLVAACGPAPLGTSWPALSTINDECGGKNTLGILVAFNDRIAMVNPATGQDMVLLTQDCNPRPLDSEGKPKIWEVKPGNNKQFYTTPIQLDSANLLAVAYDQHMFRIELASARTDDTEGTPIDGIIGHSVTDPVANDKFIFVPLNAKNVVALDRNTLDVQWTFPTEHGVWAKPLLLDNVLYLACLDHNLYAVNADTGEEIWHVDLGGALTSTPLAYNGHLYIGTFTRNIYEISMDGQIVTQYATDDWVWGTPVVVDDILYDGDLGGTVYALDTRNNLKEIWKQKVAQGAIRATPLIVGDVMLVASRDQNLYWLNRADGTPVKDSDGTPLKRQLDSPILSDILLIQPGEDVDIPEPYVVVSTLSTAQALVAYTLDNGQRVWEYKFQ